MDALSLTLEIDALVEGADLELKRATGRDGRGEFPPNVLTTYSAMANTAGGVILLGIEETSAGEFNLVGIAEVSRVLSSLWNSLNDRDQVSANLLTNADVTEVVIEDRTIIRIVVPRARREQRPVFVGKNPFGGTYRRLHDGDYRADDETVRRLLAEQGNPVRDSQLLANFTLDDLDLDSFRAYRNLFLSSQPNHPWHGEDPATLLRLLGGWGKDRSSGAEGLTLAGVLMFGRLRSILDAVPTYVVDYQERAADIDAPRWLDRITTDGTWSGNLFDFYRRVSQRLFEGLKVPFRLERDQRIDETVVHVALREALVNTLIHADYSGTCPVQVIKQPGLFRFRNPGTMRIPLVDALRGGVSDCRNRNLQKMFQLVGIGEQAGSGIPRILAGWRAQDWRQPLFAESLQPDQTTLALQPVSFFPEDVYLALDRRFDSALATFSEVQRLALAVAISEGQVSHGRIRELSSEHPRDITQALAALVRADHLRSFGRARATVYALTDEPSDVRQLPLSSGVPEAKRLTLAPTDSALAQVAPDEPANSSGVGGPKLPHSPVELSHSTGDPSHSGAQPSHFPVDPLHPNRSAVPSREWEMLLQLTASAREGKRKSREQIDRIILQVCTDRYLTAQQLGTLIAHNYRSVTSYYLAPLVKAGKLKPLYPETRTHRGQAYTTAVPYRNI